MKSKEPGEGWPRAEASDRTCDKCGAPMVRRWGPNSDYFACTAYPACKNIVDENPAPPPEVFADRKCPKCGRDLLVKTRRGTDEKFLSCAGWKKKDPDCDYTAPFPSGIRCPKCHAGDLVKVGAAKGRRPFWGCENFRSEDESKKCDFRIYSEPVREPCPKCGSDFLVRAGGKTRPVLKCATPDCGYEKPIELPEGAEGDDDAPPSRKPAARKAGSSAEANA
ncbi:MAG: topoisomerase DNA-binding C4 zinc finger domain-containing protein [Polyangiales bacterium]